MSEVRVQPDTFDHQCGVSRQSRRAPWTCPVCRRTWIPEGKGMWHSDGNGSGEIVAVLMRYDDDYTPPPPRRVLNPWWLYNVFIIGLLAGLAIGLFL